MTPSGRASYPTLVCWIFRAVGGLAHGVNLRGASTAAGRAAEVGDENWENSLQPQEECRLKRELLNRSGVYPKNCSSAATRTDLGEKKKHVEVQTGMVDVKPLATHLFPLERIAEAFEMVAAYDDGVLRAMIDVSA